MFVCISLPLTHIGLHEKQFGNNVELSFFYSINDQGVRKTREGGENNFLKNLSLLITLKFILKRHFSGTFNDKNMEIILLRFPCSIRKVLGFYEKQKRNRNKTLGNIKFAKCENLIEEKYFEKKRKNLEHMIQFNRNKNKPYLQIRSKRSYTHKTQNWEHKVNLIQKKTVNKHMIVQGT